MNTILLIDDESSVRGFLRTILEQDGYQVMEAENGRKGLQIASQHELALVFCDLYMPDTEGLETIRVLRERDPELKIVAMSGGSLNREVPFLHVATLLGANGAISKPFSINQIRKLVDEFAPLTVAV